jgi:hypothetical protein
MPVRHSKLVSSREREYGNGAANFSVAHAVQVNHIQTPNGIEPSPKFFKNYFFKQVRAVHDQVTTQVSTTLSVTWPKC